ncbi:MAG: hypothetical protein ACLRIL_08545 [Fusicatenibacter saccharivorans]
MLLLTGFLGRVGHVSDDNTDFFSADEKSGTGNAGFSAEPGE